MTTAEETLAAIQRARQAVSLLENAHKLMDQSRTSVAGAIQAINLDSQEAVDVLLSALKRYESISRDLAQASSGIRAYAERLIQ
jgi:SOS-response transcriptional repressor LexA